MKPPIMVGVVVRLWLLFVVLMAPRMAAARTLPAAHGFVIDQWTTADGLPLDHATDVAFTPDGFVWVATFEGLVRFDGVRFAPMDEAWITALGTRRIAYVATNPRDGALWILGEERRVGRYADGVLRVWDGPGDLGGAPVRWRMGAEASWLWTGDGVYRLEDAPVRAPWPENHGASAGMATAQDGSILFAAQGGAVFHVIAGGAPRRLGAVDGVDGSVREMGMTAAGVPFIVMTETPKLWDGARFVHADAPTHCALPGPRSPFVACPPRGAPDSPWRVSRTAITHEGREVWPLHVAALEAVVDPRGDLWVPTAGDGLLRVRPAVVRNLPGDPEDPRVDRLWLDSADRLWLRRSKDWWWSVVGPEARRTGGPGLHLGTRTFSFASELTPDRFLFVGKSSEQVLRLVGDALVAESERPGDAGPQCAEVRLADGTRVFGGGEGLYVLHGDRLVALALRGEAVARARSLVPLPDGALAIGTKGQGVLLMDATRAVRRVEQRGSLLVDNIRHMRRQGDTLWVSTEEEGLCAVGPVASGLMPAVWRCFRPGGAVRGVHASEEDGLGRTWLASNVGLWVGESAAFAAFADGAAPPDLLQLGLEAGMVRAEANGAYCGTVARDRDGVLWFPTQGGAAGVDPAGFRFPGAPQVHLDDAPSERPRMLEPDEILHLSWSAPAPVYAQQVVFRTRLGDAAWSAAQQDRGVTLAQLPPGPFRFEVQAGLAGAWGPVAALEGERRTRWREGWGPWLLGTALALVGGGAATRLRTRALRRRQRALELEVSERTAEARSKTDALLLRTAQMAEQSARLAELEGLRTRAIVNLHHELRTPLTLVMTGIERLARAAEAQERPTHERVLRNAGRLQALMGQLADIARLEAGEIVPRAHRLDLRAQMDAIVSRFQGLAAERGLTLVSPSPGPPLHIWMDPDILDKILGNLIHNALKFTPPGGLVGVVLQATDEQVRVAVDDTGPGVPEHARERVFDRLYQVDRGDDRPHEGSGIGLALARELTELCGGAIGVLPGEVGGSQFWFTLPRGAAHLLPGEVAVDPASDAADPDEAIVGPEGAPLLLIVEDHPDMRAWFVEELCAGFRVATAADGERGLARARELRPVLVVSDVMMPKLDGLALARALHEQPAAPPVLLISAKVSAADRASALAVADGWLPKPFLSTELRAEVQRLTGAKAVAAPEPATQASAPGPSSADLRLLARLADAVDARLADESLSIPELARAVATSERTLHRELARLAGVAPSRWIREHRLRRAQEMLRRGEFRTVSEVAAAVGMSRAWFTRMYRAWCGRSPGEDLPKP